MKLFAIGDLHLSGAKEKPMDLFGENWRNHPQRIQAYWNEAVSDDDLVLIPGDISWAMALNDALIDFDFIHALPGKKILLRGNHDYWWSSPTKIRASLPPSMEVLQNQAFRFGNLSIGGTRLWSCPGEKGADPEDEKIYTRELGRLKLSLDAMAPDTEKLIMLHYPPFGEKNSPSPATEMLEAYGVKTVLYGHLHGPSHKFAFEGERNGITYHLVSSDYLDFVPKFIMDVPGL